MGRAHWTDAVAALAVAGGLVVGHAALRPALVGMAPVDEPAPGSAASLRPPPRWDALVHDGGLLFVARTTDADAPFEGEYRGRMHVTPWGLQAYIHQARLRARPEAGWWRLHKVELALGVETSAGMRIVRDRTAMHTGRILLGPGEELAWEGLPMAHSGAWHRDLRGMEPVFVHTLTRPDGADSVLVYSLVRQDVLARLLGRDAR